MTKVVNSSGTFKDIGGLDSFGFIRGTFELFIMQNDLGFGFVCVWSIVSFILDRLVYWYPSPYVVVRLFSDWNFDCGLFTARNH